MSQSMSSHLIQYLHSVLLCVIDLIQDPGVVQAHHPRDPPDLDPDPLLPDLDHVHTPVAL